MIPYGRQWISAEDVAAVVETLESDWITQGPKVAEFERAVAARCGAGHGVAVNSGTSALHLACLALDLGPGDRLWTSPVTFVASANCARYCGADVDFVDVESDTANLDPRALEAKLERARGEGTLPKVLVVVHFAGQPCDMASIAALADEHGVALVEDASHALGAEYGGRPVGDGRHAACAVFSFHAVKPVTTGEGGMLVTNDAELARRAARLRTHGVTRETAELETPDAPAWWYEQQALGCNYRLTDIQAALGVAQLARLDAFLARRHALADRYDALLDGFACRPLARVAGAVSAWHLYVVRVPAPARRAVFDAMRAAGVGVNVHYIPVHLQPYYRRLGFAPGDFPAAEAYYEEALTLPLHPTLTDGEQDHVVETLARALADAGA